MSNQTKLTENQKAQLREFREIQGSEFSVFHFPARGVTVGVRYIDGHNTARVFVSLASPEETKFRKKVGEYNVRDLFDSWNAGNTYAGIPVVFEGWQTPEDIAGDIADAVGRY